MTIGDKGGEVCDNFRLTPNSFLDILFPIKKGEMPDWEVDKLVLFLIFFIPGFISMKIYDLLIPGERRDFSSAVFEAVGFSALNFAALSWLIILIHSNEFYKKHQAWYFIILLCILFIFPILWAILISRLLTWKKLARYIIQPIRKPWDVFFGKREPYWVIICHIA